MKKDITLEEKYSKLKAMLIAQRKKNLRLNEGKSAKTEMYGHTFEMKFIKRKSMRITNDQGGRETEYQLLYDIYVDGKKVGDATKSEYMGTSNAKMWNRYMPDLQGYNSSAYDLPDHFEAFIKNPRSGKKWLRVSLKDIPA